MAIETAQHVAMTLTDHLPILQVLVPFVAAPLVVLLGSRQLAWPITFISSAVAFVVAVLLLMQVIDGGIISYHIGGWAPPLGIEYRIDPANAFVLLLVTGVSTVVLPYARKSVQSEIPDRHHSLFYACYLLCLTGLLGVVATGDAFNVFVFLEISSLSTYVLIAQGSYRDKRALTAAYDYLI
ncbi:MAG: monovalent cation/H+ antiporter subunit D family protein, partial [Rhodobacterales bacterium]